MTHFLSCVYAGISMFMLKKETLEFVVKTSWKRESKLKHKSNKNNTVHIRTSATSEIQSLNVLVLVMHSQ